MLSVLARGEGGGAKNEKATHRPGSAVCRAAAHNKLSAACKYINVVLEGKKNPPDGIYSCDVAEDRRGHGLGCC